MAHSWIAKLTKALTSLLEVHGFDSIQCHQLTQVTIMIRQAFVEDTVIHANGRPNQNWLGANHLSECSDTSAQFCALFRYCGQVDFHNGMCQIVDGTLTGYRNLVYAN
jgi:hypothetical protein